MYLVTGASSYKDIADKMLYGIKNTAGLWVKGDGNLYYAYFNGGEMGREDYPYLTYDDLFYTQELLELINNQRDPDLQNLMNSKKRWMDKNNIKGYRID